MRTIESYVRGKLSKTWGDTVRLDKCEECGSVENLCVHHGGENTFIKLLDDTMTSLGITYKEFEEYTDKELNLICELMIGKHYSYALPITLCKKCHNALHSNEEMILSSIKNYGVAKMTKNELLKKYSQDRSFLVSIDIAYDINKTYDFLKNNLGNTFLINGYRNSQKDYALSNILIYENKNRAIKTATSLNIYLEKYQIPYRIFCEIKKSGNNRFVKWTIIHKSEFKGD